MESERFDGWVRTLTTTRTRRGAVLGLLSGGLGLLGAVDVEAKKHKKKKKKKGGGGSPPGSPPASPPAAGCGTCGSCTECQGGTCVNQADNTGCNGGAGLCGNGTCNLPPTTCAPFGTPCTVTGPSPCCGGACNRDDRLPFPSGLCTSSQAPTGSPCFNAADCRSGRCAGYRCAPAPACTPERACGATCCPEGQVCGSNGACVDPSCCSGSAACGGRTSVGTVCCVAPSQARCCCPSSPGASDGFVECCTGAACNAPCPNGGGVTIGGISGSQNPDGTCAHGGDAERVCLF